MKQLLLFLLFIPQLILAQDFDRKKMDRLLGLYEEHNKAMGSVALTQNGEVVYQRGFGFAGIDDGDTLAINPQTQFRIGSISKTFTATLVLHQVESGDLKLSDKLSKFYPDVTNAAEISIRQLLQHSSGIHNLTNDSLYSTYMEKYMTQEAMLDIIRELPSDFAPGSEQQYSNSNYILLGYILEQVSEKSYAELLEEVITEPLNLKFTTVGSAIELEQNQANSFYGLDGWEPATETDMSVPGGAGALISTPSDLSLFIHALRNGQIISQALADTMLPPKGANFGLGLFTIPFHDQKAYGHNGGIDGFSSTLAHFDEGEYSLAITLNASKVSINTIAIGILSIYNGTDYEMPDFKEVTLASDTLEKYVGVYQNANFPMDITISRKGQTLRAQATGQPAFSLQAEDSRTFTFEPASIKVVFHPAKNEMRFQQGNVDLVFEKKDQ